MHLRVGDPIPLSIYFHPSEEILTVHATITTRTPYTVLVDDVILEPVEDSPGLFGIEIDGMPDAAFVDVFYYAFKEGVVKFVANSTEQFGRLDEPEFEDDPLIGIIVDDTIIGIISDAE